MNFRLFNCVSHADLHEVISHLQERNFVILELPNNIRDGHSFFEAARGVLPFDPPLGELVNWDGFADSLFGGLDDMRKPRVAVIWPHVERLLKGHLEHLLDITNTLQHVALQVATPKSGIDLPVQLIVFLFGEGENFPRLNELA